MDWADRRASCGARRIGTTLYRPGGPGTSGAALTKQGETSRPEVLCPSVGRKVTAKVITKRRRHG
ncbi:hypothetical protein GCM10018952_68480 [Streptosporangium vulgare]